MSRNGEEFAWNRTARILIIVGAIVFILGILLTALTAATSSSQKKLDGAALCVQSGGSIVGDTCVWAPDASQGGNG